MGQGQRGWRIEGVAPGAPDVVAGLMNDLAAQPLGQTPTGPWSLGFGGLAQGGVATSHAPSGTLSINLATGQNAAGVIQLTGDMADANWTVSNADNYKNGPIAYTTTPSNVDWFNGGGGNPGWFADGPNSCWIAADPDNTANGAVVYTMTFNLGDYDPAHATLQGGQFSIDDVGYVFLNGHQIGSAQNEGNWGGWTALSSGAGDFVTGVNTIVIETSRSDNYLEAARLEGFVDDSVTLSSGPIHWASDVSGAFDTAANWTGGLVPGPNNNVFLDASGSTPYTVTASANDTVGSIHTAATATLDITGGLFAATAGGGDTGAIQVEAGASLSLGGTFINKGILATGSDGLAGSATIYIAQATTLEGTGVVTLGAATSNQITGTGAAAILTNLGNTISGSGLIGGGDLTLVNGAKGVIDGSAAGITVDASGGTDSNAGLIESAGGLTLRDGSLSNTGSVSAATVLTLDGATLDDTPGGAVTVGSGVAMTNGAILGGALSLAAGASLDAYGADTIGADLTNAGTIAVEGGANLDLQGGLTNDGVIGFVGSKQSAGLTIASAAISNAGVIKANGEGTVVIDGSVDNDGRLKVYNGTMTVDGAVTGAGRAIVAGGTMTLMGAFDQRVRFVGDGDLVLGQSQGYAGAIVGFSASGATTLDLRDIGFVDAGEATFEGNTTSGVLTVTDGTHTASIKLIGDFTGASFVAADDGAGGTTVVAQAAALKFTAAAAGLGGGSAGAAGSFHAPAEQARTLLAEPLAAGSRIQFA